MPCKQKYLVKNMTVKIQILILFYFCLLCYLSSFSIVAVSSFNFRGPCRWFQFVLDGLSLFQMVLACFRWFQVVLDRFRSFQLIPHFRKYPYCIMSQISNMVIIVLSQGFSLLVMPINIMQWHIEIGISILQIKLGFST